LTFNDFAPARSDPTPVPDKNHLAKEIPLDDEAVEASGSALRMPHRREFEVRTGQLSAAFG
jgi:hypothetical protein